MTVHNASLAELPESEPAWRQERRNRIVAAATELFHRAPYSTVQMDDIARLAGVSKPTLYRYFPAKDELFLAVFDVLLTELETALGEVLQAAQEPETVVVEMIRVLVARLSTRLASLSLLGGDNSGVAIGTRRLFAERRQNLVDLLSRALRQGQAAGAFKELDVEATAPMLLGLIRGGLLAAPDMPPDRMTAAATELVLRGTLRRA